MRAKAMRRQLVALGCPPYTPTEEQRELVRVLAFNGCDHERIAAILEVRLIELQYHFRRELELSEDYILAVSAQAVRELAAQRNDLGVALRANQLMLQSRSRRWRIPTEEVDERKPVEAMSLIEVDRAIAELERRQRDHAEAADAQAPADDLEGEPEGVVPDGGLRAGQAP